MDLHKMIDEYPTDEFEDARGRSLVREITEFGRHQQIKEVEKQMLKLIKSFEHMVHWLHTDNQELQMSRLGCFAVQLILFADTCHIDVIDSMTQTEYSDDEKYTLIKEKLSDMMITMGVIYKIALVEEAYTEKAQRELECYIGKMMLHTKEIAHRLFDDKTFIDLLREEFHQMLEQQI